jgi:hypothetical protein
MGLAFFEPGTQQTLTTYVPQTGTPTAISNFVNPQAGCNWVGVGGQIFKKSGAPDTGLVVRISGTLEGRPINVSAVSGSSLQFGPGGYDLALGNHPAAGDTLWLQLTDLAGRPKSGEIRVPTFGTCNKNLTVINLVQTTFTKLNFLPLVTH